jgi:tRNA-modifying protein YgfZ
MMDGTRVVDLGMPALLEFRGPDAVRFLNGQLTQDVRRVAGSAISLPSCVTDAKGKLQFRVTLTDRGDGVLWVECPAGPAGGLEARLTRYLIADDVEVVDLTGQFALSHGLGTMAGFPPAAIVRESGRFGAAGKDVWVPVGDALMLADDALPLAGDELEAFRIANGVPFWGRELVEGMLPPEALLDITDISYQKGCYIGQEVISRIKSAGKVNRKLTRFVFDADAAVIPGPLVNGAGEITSVSPLASGTERHALGYLKRGAVAPFYQNVGGESVLVTPA